MVREDLHKLIDGELDLVSLSEDELNVLQNDLKSLCESIANAKIVKKNNALKERAAAVREKVEAFKQQNILTQLAEPFISLGLICQSLQNTIISLQNKIDDNRKEIQRLRQSISDDDDDESWRREVD